MRIAHLLALAVAASLTSAAQAETWCGYVHAKSIIECGYSTVAQCENAVGKGGMCFVDPDTAALSGRRARPDAGKATHNRSAS